MEDQHSNSYPEENACSNTHWSQGPGAMGVAEAQGHVSQQSPKFSVELWGLDLRGVGEEVGGWGGFSLNLIHSKISLVLRGSPSGKKKTVSVLYGTQREPTAVEGQGTAI